MGSFKRALFGYRRNDVDAAIAARDAKFGALEHETREAAEATVRAEAEAASLSGMVLEREREIRGLGERLREANERHERSIVSLRRGLGATGGDPDAGARAGDADPDEGAARGGRGEPAHAGPRRRPGRGERTARHRPGTVPRPPWDSSSRVWSSSRSARWATSRSWSASRTRSAGSEPPRSRSSASPRAGRRSRCGSTSRSSCCASWKSRPLDFNIRRTADDNLILDVDEDQGPEQHAA